MLHIAIVGCGNMARAHAQQIQKLGNVKVVALVDPVKARSKEFKTKWFGEAREFASFDQLLAKPPKKLEAVLLVTPHSFHYPHAKAALEKGLHVLVEKPMVTRSEHAYDLWKTVKRTKKLLGIAFQAPYTPAYGYLAGKRDAGEWGKVQIISGWMSQAWLSITSNSWRQEPEISGGGQMYDSGAHLLNGIMWLMNEAVVEVGCFYDRCGSPVDINGVAIARFESGAIASVAIGGNCPQFHTQIHVQTDQMLIVTDQYGGKLEITGKDGKRIDPPAQKPLSGTTPIENFAGAVLEGKSLTCPVRYGVLLSALMDAMYESGKRGKVVKVKPVPAEI